jgi:hypothetical protein
MYTPGPSALTLLVRPSAELHALLNAIVTKATVQKPQLKSLLFTEFGNVAPLHVSLSRPLVLWTDEKDDFLDKFTSSVQGVRYQLYDSTSGSSLAPFEVSVVDVECFVNHESTRQFLVLKLNMSPEVRPFKSQANDEVECPCCYCG